MLSELFTVFSPELETPSVSEASEFACKNIIVFNGCEVRTENSVTRDTVRHHNACQAMPNSYPQWQNFQFAPNNHYEFSCKHFLQQLQFSLNTHYFYNLTLRYLQLLSRNIYDTDVETSGGKWHQNVEKKRSWCHARELSYIPAPERAVWSGSKLFTICSASFGPTAVG